MVNLNCILATYLEWGQKVPPLSLFGGRKACGDGCTFEQRKIDKK